MYHEAKVIFDYVDAKNLKPDNVERILGQAQGILVPGGFGPKGIDGMITAVNYARTHKKPYFGICLGMQCAVIEFSRNVAGMTKADSEEFKPKCRQNVIFLMTSWYDPNTGQRTFRDLGDDLGGSMRLGSYPCRLTPDTKAIEAYEAPLIHERHRHRYEFNPDYLNLLCKSGLVISGQVPENPMENPDLPSPKLIEIVELKDHPWFLGCQFHPEFKSSPMKPHPLFKAFIKAALIGENKGKKSN
jgi:CTP synthase